MYFPYFITYIAVGFSVSIAVFFWAVKNQQFKDQKRARFLPLENDDETAPVNTRSINKYETYALGFLACAGLATSAGVLIFALISA